MFGWFKKREDPDEQKFARLYELFKIGDTFKYLGRECVVCNYSVWTGFSALPCLVCDYADNHGVIHQVKFRLDEAEIIAKRRA